MKNIEQSLKRNGPLDAQGIEMRLVDCRKGGGGGGGGGGERVLSASVWPDTKCVRGFDRAGATINNLSFLSYQDGLLNMLYGS